MGYISLALNTTLLIYISAFAAVPLVYLVHSFRPTLPWSCEGYRLWADDTQLSQVCNLTDTRKHIGLTNFTNEYYFSENIPSVLFFRTLFFTRVNSIYNYTYAQPLSFSWHLLGAMFVVWGIIAIFFNKINSKRMSRCVRYTLWLLVLLLVICVTRFAFLDGSKEAFRQYFNPSAKSLFDGLFMAPIYASAAFGAGWGAVISLSSFNKFNTNIMRYSWIICGGQVFIFMLFGLASTLIHANIREFVASNYSYNVEENWIMYLTSGWVLSNLELPNMWCILFFSFLTLSAMLMIAIQLFSLLTAIFDDFKVLRDHKQKVTYGLIGFFFLNSIYFCTNGGLTVINVFSYDVLVSQTALNLLLLLIILWIYGRERLQRDIQFMLKQRFTTWRVNMLRSIGILAVLYTLIVSSVAALKQHITGITYTQAVYAGVVGVILLALPWLFLPGYAKWIMSKTTGSFRLRLKRCCQPTDWYPVEVENQQRYESSKQDINIMQPLSSLGGEVSKI